MVLISNNIVAFNPNSPLLVNQASCSWRFTLIKIWTIN